MLHQGIHQEGTNLCSRKTLFETFMVVGVCTAEHFSSHLCVGLRFCWCMRNQNDLEKLTGCYHLHIFLNNRKKEGTMEVMVTILGFDWLLI